MDSLTHLVAGALTPLAFRDTPKRAAVVGFGIAVGELPDIDIFFGGTTEALLTLHRGITHALFWQPVLVLIAVVPFYLWLHYRKPGLFPAPSSGPPEHAEAASPARSRPYGAGSLSFGRMYMVALLAVLTHIYLDCMTTFGTQALLPFSDARIGFPAMFIVDLCLTLPALALMIYALRQPPDIVPPAGIIPRAGRCATPCNAAPAYGYAFVPRKARLAARIGLAWILLYPLASLSVNALATTVLEPVMVEATARAEGEGDAAPRFASPRLTLMTEPFSPAVWKAIVDEGKTYRMGTISLFSPAQERIDCVFAKPEPLLYEALKRQQPLFGFFEKFAPLMIQTERPASPFVQAAYKEPITEYAFVDLRYVFSPDSPARWVGRSDPNFVLEARVNASGGLLAYRFLHRGKDRDTAWTLVE